MNNMVKSSAVEANVNVKWMLVAECVMWGGWVINADRLVSCAILLIAAFSDVYVMTKTIRLTKLTSIKF